MSTKTDSLAIVILAAGKGTRMRSNRPKALHRIAGRPMIGWLLETAESLDPEKIIIVTGPDMDDLAQAVQPHETVVQTEQKGTGDAVKAALPALEGFTGDVLILLADMPLLSAETLADLVEVRRGSDRTGLAVLGAEYDVPPPFGRLICNADGTLDRIVEDADCSAEQRKIALCNTGAFCVDGMKLSAWIGKIKPDNRQKEYYVTDLPAIAAAEGLETAVALTNDTDEAHGVNSRADLAIAEQIAQDELRLQAMENGATLADPDTVYFSWDTKLGKDVTVGPNVVFGPGVEVADGTAIHSFCHLEGVKVGGGVSVGPFARLRPGTVLQAGAKIGNFVEAKNASIGPGAKANHLAYIGDTDVGAGANIGAGTITCNYDGFEKHRTLIGDGVFVGSNSTLVAPLEIQNGAYIAAGSVVTEDVPADALSIARSRPVVRKQWAKIYREKKMTK